MCDKDLIINALNYLHEEYDVILGGIKNHLTFSGDYTLTNEVVRDKLNHRYEKIRIKMKKERK